VLIEAMAMRIPVVAAAGGGVGEIVTDGATGLLFAPGEDAALADRLRGLHANPGLGARLAAAALDACRARYGIDAHRQRILALYRGERPIDPIRNPDYRSPTPAAA